MKFKIGDIVTCDDPNTWAYGKEWYVNTITKDDVYDYIGNRIIRTRIGIVPVDNTIKDFTSATCWEEKELRKICKSWKQRFDK
jgi:hypothetical protein